MQWNQIAKLVHNHWVFFYLASRFSAELSWSDEFIADIGKTIFSLLLNRKHISETRCCLG